MASKAAKEAAALRVQQAEQSRQEWDRLLNLLKKAFDELNKFNTEQARNSLVELTTLLAGDLQDNDNLWNICKQCKLVMNQDDMYKRKLMAVETLISRMETEILNTPATMSQADGAITAEDRQHAVVIKLGELAIAREAYNNWEVRLKKAKATYKVYSHADGTPKAEGEAELDEEGPGAVA